MIGPPCPGGWDAPAGSPEAIRFDAWADQCQAAALSGEFGPEWQENAAQVAAAAGDWAKGMRSLIRSWEADAREVIVFGAATAGSPAELRAAADGLDRYADNPHDLAALAAVAKVRRTARDRLRGPDDIGRMFMATARRQPPAAQAAMRAAIDRALTARVVETPRGERRDLGPQERPLSKAELQVLLALLRIVPMFDQAEDLVANRQIREMTGLDDRSVRRALENLDATGVIVRQPGRGRRAARITFPSLDRGDAPRGDAPRGGDPGVMRAANRGDTRTQAGSQDPASEVFSEFPSEGGRAAGVNGNGQHPDATGRPLPPEDDDELTLARLCGRFAERITADASRLGPDDIRSKVRDLRSRFGVLLEQWFELADEAERRGEDRLEREYPSRLVAVIEPELARWKAMDEEDAATRAAHAAPPAESIEPCDDELCDNGVIAEVDGVRVHPSEASAAGSAAGFGPCPHPSHRRSG